MADQPEPTKKVRKVKNPESFRDKAVKASAPKQSKRSRLSFIKKPLVAVSRPIKRVFTAISKSKIARPLKKPLKYLGIVLLIPYFRSSYQELKLVSWPSFKESRKLTFAVLAFAIVFGASIAGLDWVLDKLAKDLFIK